MSTLLKVKGIGPAVLEKLAKLNIKTVNELLSFFPKAYVDLGSPSIPSAAEHGDFAFFEARIVGKASVNRGRRVTTVTFTAEVTSKADAEIFDEEKSDCEPKSINTEKENFEKQPSLPEKLHLVFYNQPYMADKLQDGKDYLFLGKVQKKGGRTSLTNPVFEEAAKRKNLEGFYTVYPLRGIFGQNAFKNLVRAAFDLRAAEGAFGKGLVDDELKAKYGLMPDKESLEAAHFPKAAGEVERAGRSLVVSDAASYISAFKLSRGEGEKRTREYKFLKGDITFQLQAFQNELGFNFTKSQSEAIEAILGDLKKDTPMNRILAGDVGSGKTAVAFFAAFAAIKSGYQAALMAPTEILASQHFLKAKPIFAAFGMEAALLTSSTPTAERRAILGLLKMGQIDFLIGTHAVFSNDVEFKDLALVITDEQHRFGVAQKSALEKKGGQTDTLVLSATPIPRAISLMLYDDLSLSTLENRSDRSNVATRIVCDDRLAGMYKYIADEAKGGGQAFIVCPRISDSEGMDLYSAEALYDELEGGAFRTTKTALLHGKMSADEKEQVLKGFRAGEIKVLISTTVIEVGIDVPNAGIMVVLNSERFGLAALHQLRGRVGRAGQSAYCFLHTKYRSKREGRAATEALSRLQVLADFDDGFKIAETDFDFRGGGDFLGLRQSGDEAAGKFGVKLTKQLILQAKEIAGELLQTKLKDIAPSTDFSTSKQACECNATSQAENSVLAKYPELASYMRKLKDVTIN